MSDEAIRWLFDATAWWTANFGGFAALASTPIVLPTDDYFTLDGTLEGEELAELIFASVLEHAQMLEWHVVLEAEDSFDIQRALGPLPHPREPPPTSHAVTKRACPSRRGSRWW